MTDTGMALALTYAAGAQHTSRIKEGSVEPSRHFFGPLVKHAEGVTIAVCRDLIRGLCDGLDEPDLQLPPPQFAQIALPGLEKAGSLVREELVPFALGGVRVVDRPGGQVWLAEVRSEKIAHLLAILGETPTEPLELPIAIRLRTEKLAFEPEITPEQQENLGILAKADILPGGWSGAGDRLGWLAWYKNYHQGHRGPDDDSQIKRWHMAKERLTGNSAQMTPRRAAAMLGWGLDPFKLVPAEEHEHLAKRIEEYALARGEIGPATKWANMVCAHRNDADICEICARENCPHCGASLERDPDSGKCNSCGKDWPTEKAAMNDYYANGDHTHWCKDCNSGYDVEACPGCGSQDPGRRSSVPIRANKEAADWAARLARLKERRGDSLNTDYATHLTPEMIDNFHRELKAALGQGKEAGDIQSDGRFYTRADLLAATKGMTPEELAAVIAKLRKPKEAADLDADEAAAKVEAQKSKLPHVQKGCRVCPKCDKRYYTEAKAEGCCGTGKYHSLRGMKRSSDGDVGNFPTSPLTAKEALTATEIDQAANEADKEPSHDAIAAGNAKKGHFTWNGLRIAIENPAGSVRRGVSKAGVAWATELKHHYGYIKGTEGNDGDHVDVFVSTNHPDSEIVFVINQVDPDSGKLDEHKCVIGEHAEAEAKAVYLANYAAGWRGCGGVKAMTLADFKTWLARGDMAKAAVLRGQSL